MKEATVTLNTIEIVDDLLKIAIVERKAETRIVDFIEKKLDASGKISQQLYQHTRQIKKENNPFVLLIPRHLTTVKYIEVPSHHDDEIRKIIAFQAVKQVPFSIEEIVVDFLQLRTLENGYSLVMLIIVHKDVIRKQLQLLADAEIYPEKILLNVQAISAGSVEKVIKGDSVCVACVEIDYKNINIVVIEKNVFKYSRAFSIDGVPAERIAMEIERSFKDCQQQQISLDKVIILNEPLLGETRLIKALQERIDLSIEIYTEEQKKAKQSSEYAALGAIQVFGEGMNFLPGEIKEHNQKKKKIKEYVSYGVLLGCLFFVFCLILSGKALKQEKYLAALEAQLKQIEPKAKKLAIMKKRIDQIEEALSLQENPLDVLREVYRLFPDNITLSSLSITKGKMVILKGVADNMAQVFDLIPKLETSEALTNVASKYATKRKIKGKELIEFQINAALNADGDTEKEDD